MSRTGLYGIVAEFADADRLTAAARRLREAGVAGVEAYTPYPVAELDALLDPRPSPVPAIILGAGLLGAAAGFLLQYLGMKFGYPLNIGGRPLDSWPAYIPSTYEIAVLTAIVVGFGAFATATRLSVIYEPVMDAPGFERASQDRFLLCVEAAAPGFDRGRLEALLASAMPSRIAEVPR
ncbi:MAG: DUF3341 domain-containing protein [Alphaproteobacteria bacterium]|nr:DUF3341 domain-containing protein [Alphaproteobacteria bacterium]